VACEDVENLLGDYVDRDLTLRGLVLIHELNTG